jgi:hypothetical protein
MFGRDTEPVQAYPIHQDEARAQLPNGLFWQAWLASLPEIHLRYAEDVTQRNLLEFAGGKPVVQHRGEYTPPVIWPSRVSNTEGLPRIDSPNTPIPATRSQQLLDPAELPDFLRARIPGQPSGALPVARTFAGVRPLPEHGQPSQPLRALPPWITPPEDLIYDLPTEPSSGRLRDVFTEAAGLLAEPKQQTSALEQLTELAGQTEDEDTTEVPAFMRRKHTKESE